MTFEHKIYPIEVRGFRQILEPYLQEVWRNKAFLYASEMEVEPGEPDESNLYQPFFKFDGDKIFARNFVGFVQIDGQLIEVYPKIFRDLDSPSKHLMLKHLFFWFRYCRKIRFPYSETDVDSLPEDSIPELLIYLFARQCLDVIQQTPYSTYEEIQEALYTPRARIDFSRYISNGLAKGQYHKVDCIFEPFSYDNRLNRAIKYVCRLLLSKATFPDTRGFLRQIIFVLDEVDDMPCDAATLDTVQLNAFFSDYAPIVDWCRRFLQNQLYSHRPYDLTTWSLLLPMEYVFEDFVAGFLEQHFSKEWIIHVQKQGLYLTSTPKAFQMKHDLYLEHRLTKERVIVDTKYKIRQWSSDDKKLGVSQSDMYQMLSYAVRRKCSKVILIYPNCAEVGRDQVNFNIDLGFDHLQSVNIAIVEIPFWSIDNLKDLEKNLCYKLRNILEDSL